MLEDVRKAQALIGRNRAGAVAKRIRLGSRLVNCVEAEATPCFSSLLYTISPDSKIRVNQSQHYESKSGKNTSDVANTACEDTKEVANHVKEARQSFGMLMRAMCRRSIPERARGD